MENNLNVAVACYPSSNSAAAAPLIHQCNVSNIPLQKWVNLIISVYGRTLDIYLDGKLVNTCVLPGIAKINQNADVFVTPAGGFSGWTSTFQYWPESCDPQKAWDIYKKGYGGSWLGNFGKYSVKVSLMEGETEEATFEI
jgi:hypothetical protein